MRSIRLNVVSDSTKKTPLNIYGARKFPTPVTTLQWSTPLACQSLLLNSTINTLLQRQKLPLVTHLLTCIISGYWFLLSDSLAKKEKTENNNNNNNNNGKQTNKQTKVILTVCFVWFLDINIYRFSTLQRRVNVIDTDISKDTMLLLIAMNITYKITTKWIYYNNWVTFFGIILARLNPNNEYNLIM